MHRRRILLAAALGLAAVHPALAAGGGEIRSSLDALPDGRIGQALQEHVASNAPLYAVRMERTRPGEVRPVTVTNVQVRAWTEVTPVRTVTRYPYVVSVFQGDGVEPTRTHDTLEVETGVRFVVVPAADGILRVRLENFDADVRHVRSDASPDDAGLPDVKYRRDVREASLVPGVPFTFDLGEGGRLKVTFTPLDAGV